MPRFNLTWLYVVIAIVLGVLMLNKSGNPISEGGGMSRRVDYTQFQKYVTQGYASRIVVDKKDGSLMMFITGEHVRDVFKTGNPVQGRSPYVEVEVPSMDRLQDFIDAQQQAGNFTGTVSYQRGSDGWMNFFWSFGPLIFFALLWIFMLRRVGSGGGGGPMGIFNVGKSRARLVEKDQADKVTFADVAGRAGA